MPHDGYKASGSGKDMSTYSFDEYTNINHVPSEITGNAHKGWHDTVSAGNRYRQKSWSPTAVRPRSEPDLAAACAAEGIDYEFACGQANPTNRETSDQLPRTVRQVNSTEPIPPGGTGQPSSGQLHTSS